MGKEGSGMEEMVDVLKLSVDTHLAYVHKSKVAT